MARQQEVRNAFLDSVLVVAIPTHELPTRNAGLHEQGM